ATNRRYPAFDLLGNIYALVNSAEVDTEYYLWDVLTVMAALFPEIVETEVVKSSVLTTGMAAARFERDAQGRAVTLVTHADSEKFWRHYDRLCKTSELF
ncbi:MAG: ABC transporter substrate-binding protein, partial [Limosilactobacillus sp.]|nr:ABC transporter substrate-binding protein [Limosilactobacillus sp.]